MPIFLRNLILVFIMLWLPLQGYAAANMPTCQHTTALAEQTQHDVMHADYDAGNVHHGHDRHPAKGDMSCDNCAMCHLCTAMGMIMFSAALNIKPASHISLPEPTRFSQVYLEQPHRPPLVLSL